MASLTNCSKNPLPANIEGVSTSIEADRKHYGVKIDRMEYPSGVAGVRLSLTEIAKRIREGGRSPSMQAFAEAVVRQKYPPSQHTTAMQSMGALLDYVVENVRYRPDPPMTEFTKSAGITLCVAGAPMCIPVADCDDLLVALGSLGMAHGTPVRILKQTFGATDQEHVLLEFMDENGDWIPADPTPRSPSLAVGQKAIATEEVSVDPLDPVAIGMVAGTPEAEFIGVGSVLTAISRTYNQVEARMGNVTYREEHKYGKTWQFRNGAWVEKQFTGVGAASDVANIPVDAYSSAETLLANQVSAVVAAGDTYMASSEYASAVSAYKAAGNAGASSVGPAIDAAVPANLPLTQPLTQQAWTLNAALASVNPTNPTQADANLAQSYAKQIVALYYQAIVTGRSPNPTGAWKDTAIVLASVGAAAGLIAALYVATHHKRLRGR